MSDDISLFHPRMRLPAVIALVFGLTLGFLAVGAQRIIDGTGQSLVAGVVLGLLAGAFLYGIMYRNLSQQIAQEESSPRKEE
jgi:cytosine/uracil/thiamine/allantoin permease